MELYKGLDLHSRTIFIGILGILPQGYIYPKKERSVRDLARKRMFLVRHRTAHKLSLQSLIRCCCAHNASADKSRTWRITKQGPHIFAPPLLKPPR